MNDEVFTAIARAAVEATNAASAAVIAASGEELRVVGASGDHGGRAVGESVEPGDESIGFVLASGQMMSIGGQASERESAGVHKTLGAVLSVPCLGGEGVLGVLEVRSAPGMPPFSPEASELAGLFARVAAAALEGAGEGREAVATPEELAAELRRLADADANRYAAIASVLGALLAHG